MSITESVREQLRHVVDPCSAATGSNLDIVEMGLIKSIEVSDNHAKISMILTTPTCHMVPYFTREIEEQVAKIQNIDSIELNVDFGMEWTEEMMSDKAKEQREKLSAQQAVMYQDEVGHQ